MLDQKIKERISNRINDKIDLIMVKYERGVREIDSSTFTDIIGSEMNWHLLHDYFINKIVRYYIERINDRLGQDEPKYLEIDLACLICGAFSKIIRQTILEELYDATSEALK